MHETGALGWVLGESHWWIHVRGKAERSQGCVLGFGLRKVGHWEHYLFREGKQGKSRFGEMENSEFCL